MDRLLELGRLYDYYGPFLSERQRVFIEETVNEDMSLSEIAERERVSRQAVRDGIVHATEHLEKLENELHLVEKTEKTRTAIRTLIDHIGSVGIPESEKHSIIERLNAVVDIWED